MHDKKYYPVNIVGDYLVDDFFESNPDVAFWSNGLKEFKDSNKDASKIMWCMYLCYDPRSYLYERKTVESREKEIKEKFFDIDWQKYVDIKNLYLKEVLVNDDVLTFVRLMEHYDRNLTKGDNIDYGKKIKSKKELNEFKDQAYSVLNSSKQRDISAASGDKAGFGARRSRMNSVTSD